MEPTSEKVILYGDILSQPTRAIYWFLLLNNINHEFKIVSIAKHEQKSEEYAKINPIQKLPVIQYKGVTFIESHAILRFLSQEFKLDQFYPTSLIERAKIDEYLDWHHLGLRKYASTLFFLQFAAPKLGVPVSEVYIKDSEQYLPIALKHIDSYFLKNGENKFIGGNKLTIADLSCFSELKELDLIKYDYLSNYPNLSNWYKTIEKLEHYKQINGVIDQISLTGKIE